MQDEVARFVGELRVALAREGIMTFGAEWSICPPIGSQSWNVRSEKARHVMRLGFGEAECAAAIKSTGESGHDLWPEDSLELTALRLMLVHIHEELETRVSGQKYVVLAFPDEMAQVRPEREPGRRRRD